MQMQEWFLKLWNWHNTVSDPYMWKRRMRRQVTYYTISYKSLCWPDSRVHLHLNWCDVSWIALFKILPCCQTLHVQGISGNFPFQGIRKNHHVVVSELWSFCFSFSKLFLDFFPFPLYFNLEADGSSFCFHSLLFQYVNIV